MSHTEEGRWLPYTLVFLMILSVLVVILMLNRDAIIDTIVLTSSQPEPPEGLLAVFSTPQQNEDLLPEWMAFPDIESTSTRLLATRDNLRYWAGYNDQGHICVVGLIGTSRQEFHAASGCNDLEHFLDHGIFVTLKTGSDYTAAVLFPDGYQQTIATLLPTADLAPNLIILNLNQSNRESLPAGELTVPPDAGAAVQDELELIMPLL